MTRRSRIVLAVLWIASLVGVRTWAQSEPRVISKSEPRVIAGSDIGFRVERVDARGTPMGSLVVRMDGKWVEVGFASKMIAR